MRRKDLEVTDIAEIIDIIDRCTVLHLGINDTPTPYIVPLNFGYKAGGGQLAFFFHTAKADTRKTKLLAQNPNVSFETECGVEVYKSENSCHYSTVYECVMGSGTASVITDEQERREALDCIMFCNGFKDIPDYPEKSLKRTALYRIDVAELSAKAKPRL